MKVVQIDITELIPCIKNPRKNDNAVDMVASSIKTYGFRSAIVVDEKMEILAGHTRYKAAKKLKLKKVPVHIAEGLTEAEKVGYRIADNKIAEIAEWDMELLENEMHFLQELDFDLSLTGFDDDELEALLFEETEGLTDEDEVPDVPDDPVSKLGDVWLLGGHRPCCGDSTDADTVSKLLNGIEPHLMVTDPPYGVEYDASWRENHDLNIGKKIGGKNCARSVGKVHNDDVVDWSEAWALFPGNIAYVWHAGIYGGAVAESLEKCGLKIRSQIIWVKQHFVFGRGDYHWQHEPCWYAVKKTGKWTGDRKQTTVWQINNNNPFGTGNKKEEKTGHSTQKPVECMRRPIINNSSIGQVVYDPFLGSGTTVIAAETEGRICYGLEIDPGYCDLIRIRWENYTGKKAVLENNEITKKKATQ